MGVDVVVGVGVGVGVGVVLRPVLQWTVRCSRQRGPSQTSVHTRAASPAPAQKFSKINIFMKKSE